MMKIKIFNITWKRETYRTIGDYFGRYSEEYYAIFMR